MACLPLIERELRVALRKQRPVQGRLKVAGLAVGGSFLFLFLGVPTNSNGLGRSLEQVLWLAGLYSILRVPMLTAGALAEERRNQTLGLLFLSGLGAGEVFASKFLSSALVAFTNLLALFPDAQESDPVKLCKALRRWENRARALAERLCNEDVPEEVREREHERCEEGANELLGTDRVWMNQDPRGYALKVDLKQGEHLHTDWGGYGIIAPEIGKDGE